MSAADIFVDSELLEQAAAVAEPLGLTSELLIGMFVEWLVDPATRDEAAAWLLECKAKEQTASGETIRGVQRDGNWHDKKDLSGR